MTSFANRMFSPFTRRLSSLTGDKLVRDIGWYSVAEVTAKLSRLVATFVLARALTPADFGIAAIAIASFEIIRVLANNGIGQAIIRASAETLDATCNTAWRATILVCGSVALLQAAAGVVIAHVSGRPELLGMIASLGIIYLVMIPGIIPVHLLMRDGRTRTVAVVSMIQTLADNAMTAVLAIAGFGAWSVLLPRIVLAPVWLAGVLYAQRWTANPAAGRVPMRTLFGFAAPIVASELLAAVRINLDKMLVWSILGVEALGYYYFAFNAGVGLSMSLTTALALSLYPELARHAHEPAAMARRFDRALLKAALPIGAIIALQAAATFVYVPILFGSRWNDAIILVALLCASAVTRPAFDCGCQLLRASGASRLEFIGSIAFTVLTLTAFAAGLTFGLLTGVACLAVTTLLFQAGFAAWARMRVVREIEQSAVAPSNPIGLQAQTS